MDDKDRVSAFIELARFRLHRFELRQRAEMKSSISLWALMAAATAYIQTRPDSLLLVVVLALVVICHALFVGQIWIRNENDQRTAFFYIESAENVMAPVIKVSVRPPQIQHYSVGELWFGFLRKLHLNWMTIFQILTTGVLAIGMYAFLGRLGGAQP